MSYSAPIRKLSVPGPMTVAEVAIPDAMITRRKVFCDGNAWPVVERTYLQWAEWVHRQAGSDDPNYILDSPKNLS
jgi:hypothetical protein